MKLDQIFHEIRWDVHEDNPKFEDQQRPPTPEGAFDLDTCQFCILFSSLSTYQLMIIVHWQHPSLLEYN